MNRCLIITGGPIDLEFAAEFLKERTYDYVAAVDAGFLICQKLGIRPDLLVGDFDTYGREEIRKVLDRLDCTVDIHRPEKDETDTELAFSDIREAGYEEADVLGATGGRLDHELSNIYLLAQARRQGLTVYLYDRQNRIYVLDSDSEPEREFRKNELFGTYLSFLPLTETVTGITLTGFKYPLTDKSISMRQDPGLCVSNELAGETARIAFRKGILLCIESRD